MRARTFVIPFTRIVDPETTELEFDATDTLTVRPLYSNSAAEVAALLDLERSTADAKDPEKAAQEVILATMKLCIVEWTLRDGDGKTIPTPTTPADLTALPAGLAGAFYPFLTTFRGDGPNPTTGS